MFKASLSCLIELFNCVLYSVLRCSQLSMLHASDCPQNKHVYDVTMSVCVDNM